MDKIKLKVNGVPREISGSEISSEVVLLDYLRNYLQLRGTKYMCREGGCGACIVTAAKGPGQPHVAVNSCLVSVGTCQGWDITTIEGLGNRHDGYHPLQTALVESYGTQCGYCTCGWVMSMHGLLESKKEVTMHEVEDAFGSNLCRCTGYRPILDAFKKFAKDAPRDKRITDIEDLYICKKKGVPCRKQSCDDDEWCMIKDEEIEGNMMKKLVLSDGKYWIKPRVLQDVFDILLQNGTNSYMFVGGNTAKGAFPVTSFPQFMIDISKLRELKVTSFDQNLIVGAGLTLTEFMDILKAGAKQEYFSYLQKLYDHINLVAHIPIRNVGTIAGNLMIKHAHIGFQSDIFLLLETVGAQLTIVDIHGKKQIVTMQYFLKMDMKGKIILNVMLPPLGTDHHLITFKTMPRSQSSHAIVNAGFLYQLDSKNIVIKATIVFGALSDNFIHATATEHYLVGKQLFSNETLQAALKVLDGEMVVTANPPEPSVEYRRFLAKALFYKGLLKLCPESSIGSRYLSGRVNLHEVRPVSSAKQTYSTDSTMWPINQPMPKLESKIQSAGEAIYADDIPTFNNEVFGALVLSTVACGTITKIDATEALRMPGVLKFLTAKDIPGENNFTPSDGAFYTSTEEVFCSGNVKYYGQPIGLIVAETQHQAEKATKYVKVTYVNLTTPVVDILEARKDSSRNALYFSADATDTGSDVSTTITGSNILGGQYACTMETMVCVGKPTEEGLEVYASTQYIDGTHLMISRALNMDQNKIDVYVRRVGGGYGMKISRSILSAVACSLVVKLLNRPCRVIQNLVTNMKALGKRMPSVNDYTVQVNSSGVIQQLDTVVYEDNGYKSNEIVAYLTMDVYNNCYDTTKINYKVYNTITDTAKNTFVRCPGTCEVITFIELLMEQISYELSLDPIALRLANLGSDYSDDMNSVVSTLKTDSDYDTRRAAVNSFNTQNRWKKRGLRMTMVRWAPAAYETLSMTIAVFQGDGTVIITHGGVEMGQGLNTKCAQIAAYFLKIPIDLIVIKANNTTCTPNCSVTGGSLTTQNMVIGVRRCCEALLAKLEPIRATLTNPTWQDLITAAYSGNVDLRAQGYVSALDVQTYNIYAAALCEVEIDLLTGEHEIIRVDIIQDVGLSVSPEIDMGQIEGSFMMGMGYFTCEELAYDSSTGELLTDRVWHYYLPEAKDIPQDLRVSFYKNSYSNEVILGSKATGEPAFCLSIAVPLAIREAITMARQESGIPTTTWFAFVYAANLCDGLEITTIEEVGNRKKGYHPIQTTLADNNGSQCGYCSPGWVMAMYSLLQSKKEKGNNLTMLEIEKSFASNICRCTGYRNILRAFKRFASDSPNPIPIPDIEELQTCSRTCKAEDCLKEDWCLVSHNDVKEEIVRIKLNDGKIWYKVKRVEDIYNVLQREGTDSYKLICGNTARGAYPNDNKFTDSKLIIDISRVDELKGYYFDQNLVIGAETTLSEWMDIIKQVAKENEYFDYLNVLYEHLTLVAHIAVRNVGSIAGNLMIKYNHHEFQSDVYLLLETIGAYLVIANDSGKATVSMRDFLKLEMNKKIIYSVLIPPLSKKFKIFTFTVKPRSQNAHAIVNIGLLFKLTLDNTVINSRIVFGGLSPNFSRAMATERYLVGKKLFLNETLQGASQILEDELVVTENLPEPSAAYRKKLALGLFYKGLLSLCPANLIGTRYKSGATKIHETRGLSEGKQVYDTDQNTWPVNKPIPKIEGLIQCAGEAKYTDDVPVYPYEVHGAFVLSTVGKGKIVSIDPSAALKYPGVLAFYSATDIPGLNSFTPADDIVYSLNEEVFCSGAVKYYSQPIGLIVAETQAIADKATNLLKIKYTDVEKVVTNVEIAKKDPNRNQEYQTIKAKTKGRDVFKVINGGNTIDGQYHFTIETLVCVATPTEEGLAVYGTSQWLSAMQLMISRALLIDQNRIDVHVLRLGGTFGIKISRSIQTAVAASLVAVKMNRPCRIIQTMETNTKAMGKRFPCSTDYEVGVNKLGKFQYVNYKLYEDNGYSVNEDLTQFGVNVYNNAYDPSTWNYTVYNTLTDTAKNTWFRSPGTLENIAMVELMMEQISYELSIDPVQLRLSNLDPKYKDLKEMFDTLKTNSNYNTRKATVKKFNSENRWKKRGLRVAFVRWEHIYARYFDVTLDVYQGDGTVAISHGGVEIGQGINTNAAAVAAYLLNIPIEKVVIKENNTIICPNSAVTGGSLTTQNIVIAVEKACEQLLARLQPVRDQMENASWEEIVKKSFEMYIDLQAHGFAGQGDIEPYTVFGTTIAEVEIDVLTGESEIIRVDVLQDAGKSLNPENDVGQIEGGFIMGSGYWTSEHLVYSDTGELLTDRTWNYYVPQARDIPQDFRIYLRKNSYTYKKIFGSKVCTEPPTCTTIVIPITIREAIVAAREERGLPSNKWFNIDGPYTTEQICLACETKIEDFKYY